MGDWNTSACLCLLMDGLVGVTEGLGWEEDSRILRSFSSKKLLCVFGQIILLGCSLLFMNERISLRTSSTLILYKDNFI